MPIIAKERLLTLTKSGGEWSLVGTETKGVVRAGLQDFKLTDEQTGEGACTVYLDHAQIVTAAGIEVVK